MACPGNRPRTSRHGAAGRDQRLVRGTSGGPNHAQQRTRRLGRPLDVGRGQNGACGLGPVTAGAAPMGAGRRRPEGDRYPLGLDPHVPESHALLATALMRVGIAHSSAREVPRPRCVSPVAVVCNGCSNTWDVHPPSPVRPRRDRTARAIRTVSTPIPPRTDNLARAASGRGRDFRPNLATRVTVLTCENPGHRNIVRVDWRHATRHVAG